MNYHQVLQGDDNRVVNPYRERKSVGGENTFSHDLSSIEEQVEALMPIVKKVFERVKQACKYGRTITLKVKYSDFSQITRSHTLLLPITSYDNLSDNSKNLLAQAYSSSKSVRLLGVSVSNFLTEEQEAIQLEIDWGGFFD